MLLQAEAPAELHWHELETVLPLPGSPSWLGINAGGSLALVTGTCTIEVRHACSYPNFVVLPQVPAAACWQASNVPKHLSLEAPNATRPSPQLQQADGQLHKVACTVRILHTVH